MGSSYCLSTDKNAMQNEQTINIRMCEENLEEKKIPPVSNLEIINKNINTNDNLSSNTGNNHINIYTNHTNFIMSNIITKNSKNNNTQKQRNNTEINVSKSKINKIVRQNKTSVDKYNHNDAKTEKKGTTKKLVALNNDVIVSGNEVNPEKIYLKTKLLGSGAFGEVWLVHHKDLKRDFAMKIIKKRKNKSHEEKEILNEIDILKKLDHPKILKIVDFYSTLKKYYIITEYCPEGELFNEIIKVGKFDEGQSAFIINQLLKAIAYCHKNNIIHRDIKPENIMITNREKNGCLQVKLIDFGTAKIFEKGHQENKYVGSSYYMAPEIIKRKYDEKCDLWSIGVILYILLTGRPPFDGNDDDEILENVKKGVYDNSSYPFPLLSVHAKDLISKLLQYDPKKRYSAEQAIEHPWFKTAEFKKKDKVNTISPELAKELIHNMTKYKSDNILKCAVIAYLVHHITNTEECFEASKLFSKIDLNSDGRIEKHELVQGFEKYWNISKKEAKEKVDLIFANIDTDFNGFIEYEEFVRAAVNSSIFMSQNYLKFAFNYFDRDSSGDITFEEIKKRFIQNSKNSNPKVDKELKNIFDSIDINHDGSISFGEFCKMMKNIMQS
jgi:calcium-dependent protein kinase